MFKGLCLEVYLHCHKTILEEYYWFLYQPEWAGIYSGNKQSQVSKSIVSQNGAPELASYFRTQNSK